MRTDIQRVLAIAGKDLTAERRTKANFVSVVFFAALTLMLFGFALGPDPDDLRNAAGGILWLTILFSGVLAFNRAYQSELESGALEALLLYPGERWVIYLGKFLANFLFVLLVILIVLPVTAVLYHVDMIPVLGGLAAILFLGTFGFVGLGTFYAAIASRIRAREVLLPLLLFPMLIPVLLASVQATKALLQGDAMGDAGSWLRLLIVFDVIFFVASIFAFEHVIEE